ncbi:hypothetical protein [Bdellovibrio sp. BCCA]|uniref:hypothetical protein n=1 Tax=Bdellovibrio sp. BCCA TaxID=3136281 RepID=UPI0030F303EE
MSLNNKQLTTLKILFEDPVRSNITWSDIESLFRALGGEISEGNGSRVRVKLKSVRRFLNNAGVTHDVL